MNLSALTKGCCTLLLFIYTCLQSFAQILDINIKDTADYTRKAKWNYSFFTGLEINQQKTTLYDATNTAVVTLQKLKNLFLLSGNYRFTYNGPSDILNSGFCHIRYR